MSRKNKVNIPDDLKQKCNVIIHGASTASAAACAGIAQIPVADNAVLAPIQVTMIVSIAKVFDQNIGEGVARGLLSTFAATFVGRGITQVLFGWVPGFGNAVNSITAAALTEAIGWMAVDHFAKGYQLDQFEYEDTSDRKQEAEQEKTADEEEFDIAIDGFFLAIGHKPNTELFKDYIDLDEQGFVKVIPGTASTNVPGVFAAGDVADPVYRQGIVAAGSGAKAAIEADRYLQQL